MLEQLPCLMLTAYRGGSMATVLEQFVREAFHRDVDAIEKAERKAGQKKS